MVLASASEMDGLKITPPPAPVIVSMVPISISSKARLIMTISSEIEDLADSYFSANVFKLVNS
ncbi:hypothetical protein K4I04_1325 [Streptococcus sanguinis]|nr:hypothetical protein [Streptococcus sanguinis]